MHIHILGICGTFMGGLAALAHEAGHKVTGCDSNVYPPMSDQLQQLGIQLIEGYGADQLSLNPDVFVVGNVVSRARLSSGQPKYPLMEAILDAGAAYTSGPQWLGEHVLRGRHVLAVAGTHGKTTTSSMLAWILESAGLEPGFLIGGVPNNFGVSARLGRTSPNGEKPTYFVIEADEYDTAFFDKRSKFVHYRPRTAILNNLEFDHADIFDNVEAIERQFHHLLRTVPGNGRVIWNADDAHLRKVIDMGCWSEQATFGTREATYRAEECGNAFNVLASGIEAGLVNWKLSGRHNQLNALAAIAGAHHANVEPKDAVNALCSFGSVKRRMEIKGVARGVTVYDDFAHHPTAIRMTLEGLRNRLGPTARILAVFEPRSNTMKLGIMKSQLADALAPANLAYCYGADLGWDPAEAVGSVAYCTDSLDDLVKQVVTDSQAGDHVICMSNGSFGHVHAKLLQALELRA